MIKMIEERLRKIVLDLTGLDTENVKPKTKLNKLGMNSLVLVEMVCAIEDEFDIEIPNADILKFKTVKDVVEYLEKNAN